METCFAIQHAPIPIISHQVLIYQLWTNYLTSQPDRPNNDTIAQVGEEKTYYLF